MSSIDFHTNDCVLALPAGFADRSVHILEWTLKSGQKVALIVQREEAPPNATLDACVEKQIVDYPSRFLGYRLDRDDRESKTPGLELRRVGFRFKKDSDVIYTHQVYLLDGSRLIVLSASALARHRDEVDQLVDEAIDGLRLRDV